METTACTRCEQPIPPLARYCPRCGLDKTPGEPHKRDAWWRAAMGREMEWLAAHPKQEPTPQAAPVATEPADAEDSPVDEFVYWMGCARMLRDLHGLAAANAEQLRARCLARGTAPEELEQRLEGASVQSIEALVAGAIAPAGWYPDPGGSGRSRYWTGMTWSGELT